jgi:hypothetical protein
LQIEFSARCVYCCTPDGIKTYAAFGVDHYRPKHVFPSLAVEYLNLYYCCNSCNSRKGKYWPKAALEATEFIPNPCEHEMFRHLKYDGPTVVAKTRAGEVAVELLALNDPVTVAWRDASLQTIASLQAHQADTNKKVEQVAKRLKNGAMTQAQADEATAKFQALLDRIEKALALQGQT